MRINVNNYIGSPPKNMDNNGNSNIAIVLFQHNRKTRISWLKTSFYAFGIHPNFKILPRVQIKNLNSASNICPWLSAFWGHKRGSASRLRHGSRTGARFPGDNFPARRTLKPARVQESTATRERNFERSLCTHRCVAQAGFQSTHMLVTMRNRQRCSFSPSTRLFQLSLPFIYVRDAQRRSLARSSQAGYATGSSPRAPHSPALNWLY